MIIAKTYNDPRFGQVTLYTITNAGGATVTLSTVGAGITSIRVPDREGRMAEVVLGYANPFDYFYDGPCAGKIPGRYAGRIAKGHFMLDGMEYRLPINNGPNSLHGGPEGFQNRIWDAETLGDNAVVFKRTSPDGEMGYPGTLEVSATYVWEDDNTLRLELRATTSDPTVLNLTNHTYFNLTGKPGTSALAHALQVYADKFVPTDDTLIPTGEYAPVEGTPMDFRQPKEVGRDIRVNCPALRYAKGYDHDWIIDREKPGDYSKACVLTDPESGRRVTMFTNMPAAHVYAGNWLDGAPAGTDGEEFRDYDAIAIECQDLPDAPNHPEFPSTVLRPGEVYDRKIVWKFDIAK